jgi:phosphoglucosamine mutase
MTGADVIAIHAEPDGRNINADCGATDPASLAAEVVAHGAAVGLALDGDADRLVAVDHTGAVVDGDHIIGICAIDRHAAGLLRDGTVVVTVMTNLGFRIGMEAAGIKVVETAVGDRYVLEALAAGGYSLGGEQSGHVIFRDLATTGDGLLTAVILCDAVVRSGRPLADLAATAMTRLPQVLVNVPVRAPMPDASARVAEEIAAVERELDGLGRVLVRPSGTEPLVRVMVEGPSQAAADAAAERIAAAVRRCADAPAH